MRCDVCTPGTRCADLTSYEMNAGAYRPRGDTFSGCLLFKKMEEVKICRQAYGICGACKSPRRDAVYLNTYGLDCIDHRLVKK
jgi:hypothetical protein